MMQRDLKKITPKKLALIFGVCAFVYHTLVMGASISNSTSSTAAIGYVFLPAFSLIFALPFALAGFCTGKFMQAEARWAPKSLLFLAVPCLVFGYFVYGQADSSALASQVQAVRMMSAAELKTFMETGPEDKWILAAVTQNPHVTGDMLHQIAMVGNPELHEKMGHSNAVIVGPNRKGLATLRLVAQHPRTRSETLVEIAKSDNNYVLNSVLRNPELPLDVLRHIYFERGYHGNYDLAVNPRTPPDVIEAILQDAPHQYALEKLLRHPNFSKSMLDVEKPTVGMLTVVVMLKDVERTQAILNKAPALAYDKEGEVLKICVEYGSPEVCQILIAHGADVNAGGFPALTWAIFKEDRPMIEMLLKNGADPHRKTLTFSTPLKDAKKQKLDDLVKLMESH